ncbi:nucleoside phosphorylase [Desulforhopalus sp. 52FAK]
MTDPQDPDVVITPRRNKNEKEIPDEGVFFVNPTEASLEMGKVQKEGGESRFLFNSQLYVVSDEKFLAGPAIGAPMAAMTMEKLIALGAKRIILFGWCGAVARDLRIGDVLVPQFALSGEGTSQYYNEAQASLTVNTELRNRIVSVLTGGGVTVHDRTVWSTDAVYREKRSYLHELHKEQGVAAVDMEFSALCSVARFRGIEFGAVLVVSDEIWGQSWRPGFTNKEFKKNATHVRQLLITNQFGR